MRPAPNTFGRLSDKVVPDASISKPPPDRENASAIPDMDGEGSC